MSETNGKVTIREVYNLIERVNDKHEHQIEKLADKIDKLEETVSTIKGQTLVYGGLVSAFIAAVIAFWVSR